MMSGGKLCLYHSVQDKVQKETWREDKFNCRCVQLRHLVPLYNENISTQT